jgi:hypothetical protein
MTPSLPPEKQEQLDMLLRCRHRGRTNLLYLCNVLLGYKDVSRLVHGEILDHLQKFPGGTDEVDDKGICRYTPACPIHELEGSRNRLIIYPRGHL